VERTSLAQRLASCFAGAMLCVPFVFLIVAYLAPAFPALTWLFWALFAVYVGLVVLILRYAEIGQRSSRGERL
jgi:hypothetical protein